MHRLAAQKLAHGRAHHGAAVRAPRVRSRPGALELHLPVLAAAVRDLTEGDRAPVSELASPVAELVSAVAGGHRIHAGEQPISRKYLRELRAVERTRLQIQELRDLGYHGKRAGRFHGCRPNPRE